MAIGVGDNDPTNSPGGPGPTYGGTGEVPLDIRRVATGFGNGADVAADIARQNDMNSYWTDVFKNLVPPDPLGNIITGQGLTPGSFLPGGGTIGNGRDGTAAGAADSFWSQITNPSSPFYQQLGGGGGAGAGGSGDFAFPYQTTSPGTPTTGGLEPGTPFMQDVDMTRQGAAESYFKNFGGGFTDPTLSQVFAGQTFAKYGANQPGVSNNAQTAFNVAQGAGMPGNVQTVFNETRSGVPAAESARALSDFRGGVPANMDAFYDNASRKAQERIDRSFGARGMYGSSAALDAGREMNTDLAADQAKEEAQYGLNRAQLGGQLAGAADSTALSRAGVLGTLGGAADTGVTSRLGALGSLGQGADASSVAGSRNAMDWTRGLSDLFNTTDAGRVAALTSGMSAAGAAQGAQRARAQDAFGNEMAFGGALSGTMGKAYDDIFNRDQQGLNDVMTLFTGAGAERFGQATDAANRSGQTFDDFFNTFGNVMKGGTGVYNSLGGGGSAGGTAPVQPPPATGGGYTPTTPTYGAAGGTPINPGQSVPGYYNYR